MWNQTPHRIVRRFSASERGLGLSQACTAVSPQPVTTDPGRMPDNRNEKARPHPTHEQQRARGLVHLSRGGAAFPPMPPHCQGCLRPKREHLRRNALRGPEAERTKVARA